MSLGTFNRAGDHRTPAEQDWMDTIVAMGCIVCRNLAANGEPGPDGKPIVGRSPAEVHHLKVGIWTSLRAPHVISIALCPSHHRQGGQGVAYHSGPGIWESLYGTQL